MHSFGLLIGLLSISLAVAVAVKRLNFPYPIALVVAGFAIALIPGAPRIEIDPEVIFYIFMPPILSEAAYLTSWRDFWKWRRAIFLLDFGSGDCGWPRVRLSVGEALSLFQGSAGRDPVDLLTRVHRIPRGGSYPCVRRPRCSRLWADLWMARTPTIQRYNEITGRCGL